jgi:hypothetical protein
MTTLPELIADDPLLAAYRATYTARTRALYEALCAVESREPVQVNHDGYTLQLAVTATAARRLAELNSRYSLDAEPIDAHLIAAGFAMSDRDGQTRITVYGGAALRLHTGLGPKEPTP